MLIFSGDRKSHTVQIGKFLQKYLGSKLIRVSLWDGYKS